ncbi:4Fe-4S ferredoxin [Anaeromyxobacter oryzisoli]|uniref:4Fe-4S ferredoxin n=1 Tax=Anaeromyxobacter oryzisoli TaxID=2925408 RepID=UPI001F5ADCB4|nr:4Fe-4S ferredoxin [Anaeromyxobacter sp. SG63]
MEPQVSPEAPQRQTMAVDVACVGFGPAAAGFLTTLARRLAATDLPALESAATPGAPLQVVCYERADDLGFGVSGVVTRGRGLRAAFPGLDPAQIPMAAPVREEKVLYLLDPVGASRRSATLRAADAALRALRAVLPVEAHALELPWTPAFLHKRDGFVFSMGQLMQWMGAQVMSTGAVQIWPGTPVAEALFEGSGVAGVRLLDQGVDRRGRPEGAYLPGLDVRAALTVVADGPVGAIGRQLDEVLGMPAGHARRDWAVGMKLVVDLPEDTPLRPGTVLHTFGFPEPEIFGFLYVHPDRVASVGIFVPSWFESPARTTYRYLQHYVQHPYLWRWLEGARLRSWGAKSILESGRRAEPLLAGDGFARIGEGSGSTNVLTSSGVDEAFTSGVLLGEAVIALAEGRRPFTRENLLASYAARRRASWIEAEGRVAERARDGFQRGVVSGLVGMALAGLTRGKLALGEEPPHPAEKLGSLEAFYEGKIPAEEIERIRRACAAQGVPLHDALMDRAGWPPIALDGKLLVTHQDALLVGGKVQAPPGYADHVTFARPELCRACRARACVEICSAEALRPGEDGVPTFDREKCVHCGACCWSCSQRLDGTDRVNLQLRAGTGGLHSAEN